MVFDLITGPGQKGIWRARIGEGGTMAWPSVELKTAGIRFGYLSKPPSDVREMMRILLVFDSNDALHELIHLAGYKTYDDEALAIAASKLPNAPELKHIPFPYGGTEAERAHFAYHYSSYWDKMLRNNCPRLKL
jgi:hypothetical protein